MEPRFRGSATSTNSFFRSLGMTIGVTIFGSIQNSTFTANLKDAFKGIEHGSSMLNNLGDPSAIFRSDVRSSIPTFILEKVIGCYVIFHYYCFSISFNSNYRFVYGNIIYGECQSWYKG